MNRIITVGSLTIDLGKIKSVKRDSEFLIVEYQARTEYLHNPLTGKAEQNLIFDTVEKECHSSDSARDLQSTIQDYWNEFLNEE